MQPYSLEIEQQMQRYYHSLCEKDRRRYAAIEAVKLGHGGISYISQLLGCHYRTIKLGMHELQDEALMNLKRVRRPGGGRKSAFEIHKGLDAAFLKVLEPYLIRSSRGEIARWTYLTRQQISDLLKQEGIEVSVTVVDQLLKKYHLRRKAMKIELTDQSQHHTSYRQKI